MKVKWQRRISIAPDVAAGHPVIKGTRVPVFVIVGSLAGGDSIEDVCANYPVTEDDVRAALAYAADMIAKQQAHAVSG